MRNKYSNVSPHFIFINYIDLKQKNCSFYSFASQNRNSYTIDLSHKNWKMNFYILILVEEKRRIKIIIDVGRSQEQSKIHTIHMLRGNDVRTHKLGNGIILM